MAKAISATVAPVAGAKVKALKPGAKPAAAKPAAVKPAAVKSARVKRRAVGPDVVREIFTRFQAVNPEPKGELDYLNPFTLLVAVVLSAQATDVGVNKATRALFAA